MTMKNEQKMMVSDQDWQRAARCRCNRHDKTLMPRYAEVGPIRWVHSGHSCPDRCESCGTTIAVVADPHGRPRWMEVSIFLAVDPRPDFTTDQTVVVGATELSSDEHTPARCRSVAATLQGG